MISTAVLRGHKLNNSIIKSIHRLNNRVIKSMYRLNNSIRSMLEISNSMCRV